MDFFSDNNIKLYKILMMNIKKTLTIFYLGILTHFGFSQNFTLRDSLQGGLPFERTCFDVLKYDLKLKINIDEKYISGVNHITFKVVENTKKIQLDLFENMKIDSILLYKNYRITKNKEESDELQIEKLKYNRQYDAVFIEFTDSLDRETFQFLSFYYSGKPLEAKNPPWDGGFIWKKDNNEKPFVGVAVQGIGASLWFPCKDSQSDEPDLGTMISIEVQNELVAVSNGKLIDTIEKNQSKIWIWEVKNPINNYNITLNIGDYVHFSDKLKDLDIDYYVLRENEQKAKQHFKEEVTPMLECFQEKFGTYPFAEDGYKLVETPFLGMEHQSAVAYGNKYKKGYFGKDISESGVGLLFDFIIVHESGHEWFGNSITSKDIADMWIHEAFTTYSEAVLVECRFGYQNALKYINGQSKMVENRSPIVGHFGVNYKSKNTDMYYKGALMLNTIRHVINDDAKWWKLILDYSIHFKHQIIEAKDVIDFFISKSGINLQPIFKQYLYEQNLPVLEIKPTKKGFYYSWKTETKDFEMPFEISLNGQKIRLNATNFSQFYQLKNSNKAKIEIAEEKFYVVTNLDNK